MHHPKVAVFFEKNLPHLKTLTSYLVWNMLTIYVLAENHAAFWQLQGLIQLSECSCMIAKKIVM